MTLHETEWTWALDDQEADEEMADEVASFKTVEDWESDATIALTRGDVFGALRIYEEILKVYPYYVKAWYNRAVILAQFVKDYRRALWAYNEGLKIEPKNVEMLHNKGKLLSELGDYEEAERCFIKALQQRPDYLKSLMALAIAYVNMGRSSDAIRAVTLAEKQKLTKEQKGDLLSVKAIVLSNMGKSKQAIKVAKQALALNPKDDSLWETMGIAYYNIKKFREAIRCLNRAIQMNPQNISARQMKRDILMSLEDIGILVPDEAPEF